MTTQTTTAAANTELSELQKRSRVFLVKPQVVLVKILAMGIIKGVYEKPRDNTAIEIKHIVQAEDRGVDPYAYRDNRADTGYCLFLKEVGVRVGHLLAELESEGYYLGDYFWQSQNNKGQVNTFQFVRGPRPEGEVVKQLPDEAKRIISTLRFNNATVWCNLRDKEGGGQYRLDTINLAKGRNTPEPSRHLHLTPGGQSYRLE